MSDITLPRPADCALSDVELFADVPAEALARLENQCRWQRFPADVLVIDARAEELHGVFILADGEVDIQRHDAHVQPVSLGQLSATACFGEFAAI